MKASRRNFLIGAGVVGGGLVVGFSMRSGPGAPPLLAVDGAYAPNAFLQIGPDNLMRFYCPRDEMGQGVTTGLATLIGEELDVDPARFAIELAGVHPDYANPGMGVQATGASNSIMGHYLPLRQVGADLRQAIVLAAAAQLDVGAGEIETDDGHVLVRGERHPYGAFVETARGLPLPENTPLKPAAEFRYIGKELPRIDSVGKATGTAVFGIDVDVPDMHHAVVVRSPVAGGAVASFDAARARGMPGVVGVVPVATGVAVVATKYWQAKKAAEAVEVEWDLPPLAQVGSRQIEADYRDGLAEEGESAESEGDLEAAFAGTRTVAADYWAPYLAHAPMEPMNAVVRIGDGAAEVWTGTQALGLARGLVARVADIDAERVTAHNTYLGGGFGRRATMSHVVEAAEAALATGKPVQVLWSREDDIRSGFYRPASLMRIEAGIDADGSVAAWRAKRVGANIVPYALRGLLPGLFPGLSDGVIDWAADSAGGLFANWVVEGPSVEGLAGDYDFPNREVRHVTRDHGLPTTVWRSVGPLLHRLRQGVHDRRTGRRGRRRPGRTAAPQHHEQPAPAQRHPDRGGADATVAPAVGPCARHRRAWVVRVVRRRSRGSVRLGGRHPRAQRPVRRRLRGRRQPGRRARADGRVRDVRPHGGPARQSGVGERRDPRKQLPRLPDPADERGPGRRSGDRGERGASLGDRRTGRAAHRPGGGQRCLRGHRTAAAVDLGTGLPLGVGSPKMLGDQPLEGLSVHFVGAVEGAADGLSCRDAPRTGPGGLGLQVTATRAVLDPAGRDGRVQQMGAVETSRQGPLFDAKWTLPADMALWRIFPWRAPC